MSGTIPGGSTSAKLDKAVRALDDGRAHEAERLALDALETARNKSDFAAMAETVPVLKSARELRWKAALAVGDSIRIMETAPDEDTVVEPGCHLVEPPRVGADARNLRLAAAAQQVPVLVLCREPLTDLKLRPIVAIGRITIRARVLPAENDAAPDIDWFLAALNELGEAAIDSLDAGIDLTKRIDGLLDRLDSIPDHVGLHDALEATCREAAAAAAADTA